MGILMNDLKNNLVMDFNYHDAKILKVTRTDDDIIILLLDGWIEGQINELTFTNATINHQFDLEDRIIYQLDDLVNHDNKKWNMSFLVWNSDNLLEKVYITSENIIAKKYQIKEGLLQDDISFEEKMEEVTKKIGKITIDKVQDKNTISLIEKIFNVKEKENLLCDFNNYILVADENLNNSIFNN